MFKWVAIACLCAFAFAEKVYNHDLGCSYHVKVEDSPYAGTYESFVVSRYDNSLIARYNKIIYYTFNNTEIMRCDERNSENDCYVQFLEPSRCRDEYYDPLGWGPIWDYLSEFEYDEKLYPVDVNCPDNSAGCKLYEDKYGKFVVVNQEGYFVNVSGAIWTFYGPPSMDEFVFDKCNSSDPNPHFSAPGDMCSSMKYFFPTQPDCPFHVSIQYDEDTAFDYYGVEISGIPVYAKLVYPSLNISIRCYPGKEIGGCTFIYDGDTCQGLVSGYNQARDYSLQTPEMFEYDSVNYPKPVVCPDNSKGCQLYCDDILEENCITVDDAGRVVKFGKKALKYLESPSLDVFDLANCSGEQLSAPLDYCAERKVVSPKLPDCSFHIKSERAIPPKRDVITSKRGDIQSHDLYGIRVNDELSMISITDSDIQYIIRFDVIRGNRVFFQKLSSDNCTDDYVDLFEMKSQLNSYYLPQPIRYNSSEYPVDAECPDGGVGCKKYCSLFAHSNGEDCVIVDADGYFVHTKMLGNLTYDTKVPLDVFETDTCNKQTHIPAPPSSTCSSSSSSSIPASTSSKTPINPSLSFASRTKAALVFVAVAVGAFIL